MKIPRKSLPDTDSIGLIAAGIAHDLNTLLTVIYGYSEMTLEGLAPDSENYSNIKKIIQAADRARALTGKLLADSMEADQVLTIVPVKDILLETIEFLRPVVTDRIVFREEILTPGVCVSADPTQLFRVFINLANNAIQAMNDSEGCLTVTLDTRTGAEVKKLPALKNEADEYAHIRFSDTGPGIDERLTDRIFEPYFTSGNHGRGTGLGLSVVAGIISAIDGEITVTSKKGTGTVIDILIPSVASGKKEKGETAR